GKPLGVGSSYQFTLTQPLSMSVTPGETGKLACVLSSGDSISSRYIYWYQQKQGEKPRYLLYYKDDSTQGKGSGVPDRFTASKDTSRNTCFLTISRAEAEDDADYYCTGWDSTANQYTVIQLHREEEQKPLSPLVTQRREPTCVSLVPMRCPGGLAPVLLSCSLEGTIVIIQSVLLCETGHRTSPHNSCLTPKNVVELAHLL
uniref:Ig-like domain-containing protein n=1 Tax=Chrysemys picta bellii TaxID=8478 RepID=A0A8C3P8R0_CHRPI